MKLNRTLLIAAISLSCSAAMAQPLSPQQKLLALQTFQSITLDGAAAESTNPSMQPGHPGQDPLSQLFLKMSGILNSGICNPQLSDNHDNNPVQKSKFTLDGARCPVTYVSSENFDTQAGNLIASVEYRVIDNSYRAFTDVDAYSMSTNESISTDNNVYKLDLTGTGTVHSQKLGQFPFTVTAHGAFFMNGNSNATLQIQATVGGAAIVLKTVTAQTDSDATSKVYLNDVQLTDEEVSTYLNPPFVPTPKDGSSKHIPFLSIR